MIFAILIIFIKRIGGFFYLVVEYLQRNFAIVPSCQLFYNAWEIIRQTPIPFWWTIPINDVTHELVTIL